MGKRAAIALILVVLGLAVAAGLLLHKLEVRIEVLETIRSGVPYDSIAARGFRPYTEGEFDYLGRKARWFRFRSSSGWGGVRAYDFGVVVNEAGIVEAAFPLSNDDDRQAWRALTGESF